MIILITCISIEEFIYESSKPSCALPPLAYNTGSRWPRNDPVMTPQVIVRRTYCASPSELDPEPWDPFTLRSTWWSTCETVCTTSCRTTLTWSHRDVCLCRWLGSAMAKTFSSPSLSPRTTWSRLAVCGWLAAWKPLVVRCKGLRWLGAQGLDE